MHQFISKQQKIIYTQLLLVNCWLVVICNGGTGHQQAIIELISNHTINSTTIINDSKTNLSNGSIFDLSQTNRTNRTINESTIIKSNSNEETKIKESNISFLTDSNLSTKSINNITIDLSVDSNVSKLENYTKTILMNNTELNLNLNKEIVLESNVILNLKSNPNINTTSNRSTNQTKSIVKKELNKHNESIDSNSNSISSTLDLLDLDLKRTNHSSIDSKISISKDELILSTDTQKEINKNLSIRPDNASSMDENQPKNKIVKKDSVEWLFDGHSFKNDSLANESLADHQLIDHSSVDHSSVNHSSVNHLLRDDSLKNKTIEQFKEPPIKISKKIEQNLTMNHNASSESHSFTPESIQSNPHNQTTNLTIKKLNDTLAFRNIDLDQISINQTTIQPLHLSHAEPQISVPHSDQHWMIPNQLGK